MQPDHREQPMPVRNDRPSIQGMVRNDLAARERVGINRYGTPLQAANGRDAVRDAYEESLDLATYLRQVIEERSLSVALIAEVLDQHHVSTDWFRRRGGWCWHCSCLTDGEEVHPDGKAARRAAARHQAEQVAEALTGVGVVPPAAGLVSAQGVDSPHETGEV